MSTLEDGSLRTGKTPLPYRQLFIVSLLQGSEPLTSSIIFPFVNQAVRESGITGGDETKTGYYAGAIVSLRSHLGSHLRPHVEFQESIFFIAECLTVVHWGRLSDRIGRKPVMLIGLVGLATSMITFGLSKSYWLLLISRFIQGMSNGNMGTYRVSSLLASPVDHCLISLVGNFRNDEEYHGRGRFLTSQYQSELPACITIFKLTRYTQITDETNIADAFAWMPLIWSVGGTVGYVPISLLSSSAH